MDRVNSSRLLNGAVCHVNSILNDCQCPQAQEIHFQKAQFFDRSHSKLGGHRAVRRPCKGNQVLRGLGADDDTRSVH